MSEFDFQKFREYMKYSQYKWRDRDLDIARRYGDYFTYNEMLELKNASVRKVLIKYKVETVVDIPFGKLLGEYLADWEETLLELLPLRKGEK